MKVLHFDCHAGISGDMALGAFVDLGVDPGALTTALDALGLSGWKLDFVREERCGIVGTRAIVDLDDHDQDDHHTEHDHRDEHDHLDEHDHHAEHGHHDKHDHHTEHGHHNKHDHHTEHDHRDEHDHLDGHDHPTEHGHHDKRDHPAEHDHHDKRNHLDEHDHHAKHDHSDEHPHNSWKEIRRLIENAALTEGAKTRALDIFSRIAEAEAQAHGVPVDEVVFHEVGAMDSIIDIVGAAICLDILKPDRVSCGELELGGGEARCAHGLLPVPLPAVRILTTGMPVSTGGFNKEMTTPTGAAILASCVDEFILGPFSFRPVKTAYGIGTRKMEKPNVLQLSWRDVEASAWPRGGGAIGEVEELLLLEANIDDMTGEALGFLMDRFYEYGALDVTFTPVTMKKSRPGVTVAVLCRRENADALRSSFFRHSTTIGFRETKVDRRSLRREMKTLRGGFGEAREKVVYPDGQTQRSKIEYEDRAKIALERNITLDEAEAIIRSGSEP